MTTPGAPRWSADVDQFEWLRVRLDDFRSGHVASVVPSGFEAYARILHPVETPRRGGRLVRWADVARWSGAELDGSSQWIAVALAEVTPVAPRPWRSQGPHSGSLYRDDAQALVSTVRGFTTTPDDCWCCLWEGYAMSGVAFATYGPREARPVTPIVADAVRTGPKVHTDYRDYFLFEASLDRSFLDIAESLDGHTPNLWWPSDRAWCVGTEIYSDSTYVGGSSALVAAILECRDLEAFEVRATDSFHDVMPEWLAVVVAQAVDDLLSTGRARIVTALGDVHLEFQRPSRLRRGFVRYSVGAGDRGASGGSPLSHGREDELREQVQWRVQSALRSLVT